NRGFPSAIRANNAINLARHHVKINAIHSGQTAKADGQSAYRKQRTARRRWLPCLYGCFLCHGSALPSLRIGASACIGRLIFGACAADSSAKLFLRHDTNRRERFSGHTYAMKFAGAASIWNQSLWPQENHRHQNQTVDQELRGVEVDPREEVERRTNSGDQRTVMHGVVDLPKQINIEETQQNGAEDNTRHTAQTTQHHHDQNGDRDVKTKIMWCNRGGKGGVHHTTDAANGCAQP